MNKSPLAPPTRILLGIAGLPSLALGVMLIVTVMREGMASIGAFEVLYACAGLLAIYIAVTGKRLF